MTIADDAGLLRQALAELPRADNHSPGAPVDPSKLLAVHAHRAALDPDRSLVVGNRGMGKSFWAHALADQAARERAATSFPEVARVIGCIGFNASERIDSVAPTPNELREAVEAGVNPDTLWRAVLVRAASAQLPSADGPATETFPNACRWIQSQASTADSMLTRADDHLAAQQRKLVVVFDALDRLAPDWQTTHTLTTALLRRALAAQSYKAIRVKLFMRSDQFEAPRLFEFPDGSKIRNTRVDLTWRASDLYRLLFDRIENSDISREAYERLLSRVTIHASAPTLHADQKVIVDALAGEFMGANEKRGRVFTWLPLHLADARGETSPRTFLTAWRAAAQHEPSPSGLAVDHHGLAEGVRQASADRLQELREDYWWIDRALSPLRGQMVPMEQDTLVQLWNDAATPRQILEESPIGRPGPFALGEPTSEPHEVLVRTLELIGVLERRANGKINVPDIFRIEAGIKRKGGVKPPRRPQG